MSNNGIPAAFIALAMVAVLVAGCTSPIPIVPSSVPQASPSASTQTLQPGSASVSISNFAFAPAELTIRAGTTVTWTNDDSVQHTVTSDSGVFDSGALNSGSSFSYTFSQAGTFAYHCTFHPGMTARIIVQ